MIVDGRFSEEYSSNITDLPSGLTIANFLSANAETREKIVSKLNSIVSLSKQTQHPFTALNTGKFEDGLFIFVEKKVRITKPIEVLYIDSSAQNAIANQIRVLVVLDPESEVILHEKFIGNEESNSLCNSLMETEVGENARLFHYRIHEEAETNRHIGGVHCLLKSSAIYESFQLSLGSSLMREDIVIHHGGKGSHCGLNGIYLPKSNDHVDYHTIIEHAVPHCTTSENFRGIVFDSARAIFNGRIHIHPDAQKTLAQLSNKNLLMSEKAEVDTKPELEIYADDVQCAHGATVAQLEDSSLHYMKTRGISEKEARVMLSFGFINELINQIPHQNIADVLRPKLAELFASEPELMEHLG